MSDATEAEIRETVQKLICEILARKRKPAEPARIVEGVSLTRDLGIDSLDILQMSAVVEKKYGIRFPEPELRKLDDLGGILAAVRRLRSGG